MKGIKVFAFVLAIGIAGTLIAAAQMMGGGMMGNASRQGSDQSDQQARFAGMMHNMQNQDMQMMNSFDSLQKDMEKMMKMKDMSELKEAMRRHYENMTDIHKGMMQQSKMWGEAMSMMNSMGMMGAGQMNMPDDNEGK